LTPKKRERNVKAADPLVQENQQLHRQIERLRGELKKAQIIIEVQKQLSEVLGNSRTFSFDYCSSPETNMSLSRTSP